MPKNTLSVPEKHQLKIARNSLKYGIGFAAIMGGPTPLEAAEIIRRLTQRKPKSWEK